MAATLAVCAGVWAGAGQAASHREAPLIANDPTADITDVYFFRSWEDPTKVVLVMNVIPSQESGSGPNYFNFGDDVLYSFHLDLNGDGDADDLEYEFRFKTDLRGDLAPLDLPLAYAAVPPITRLDGAGSAGLILRQSYTVTQVRKGVRTRLGSAPLFAVPSNVGPLTMPNYEDLAAQGIYDLGRGMRAFAGQRDETFYIDLGAVFDTVNTRRAPVPVLTAAEDADDGRNPFGNDAFSGFNVNTIALELPISAITGNPSAVIGMYASTSRQQIKFLANELPAFNAGRFVQVARMANPLVNELIIGTSRKDQWNATDPEQEARFLDFYLNPRFATALNIRFGLSGGPLELPAANRRDLVNALLKYPNQAQTGDCTRASPCSELLRLNLAVAPTPAAQQKRLTVLAGDNAGWPNGRRPNDDVTDLALRVVAGRLIGAASGNLLLGDGVNFNIGAQGSNVTANGISTRFPFLPTPADGKNRRHIDCGEGAVAMPPSPAANPC
jgi:hypothetical protein